MKTMAINGSPRKNWNTHTLLEKCLEGALTTGAETELVNLYDIQFRGCASCFICKLKGNSVSKCAMKDDLEHIFQKIIECDALILGSPIYFSNVTGEMRSFMERLLFPYSSYEGKPSSFGKKINTAFIYTMNAPAFALPLIGYNKIYKGNKKLLEHIFGKSKYLLSASTYQFDDYDKYAMTFFDGRKRLKRRETIFLEDCNKAFKIGKEYCQKQGKIID
jgi:multimeric flavodoxin WrbA